jgi:aminoglycoside/choline kinase family phosphotransferase
MADNNEIARMSTSPDTHRVDALKAWLAVQGFDPNLLKPLNGDASFRHYFRIARDAAHYIVMDAPPEKEKPQAFYDITAYLRENGIHTPRVYQADLEHGWLVIDDFGHTLLSQVIGTPDALPRYQQAIRIATQLLQLPLPTQMKLPAFDAPMQLAELQLFNEWFLTKHLTKTIALNEAEILSQSYQLIIDKLLAQPQVFVHRDFHCRNLMILKDDLGVIDFQDAVVGPYTYDLVSLIKDAYTDYAYQQSDILTTLFWNNLPEAIKIQLSHQQYLEDIRWTGIQRHLKVIGIFARLYRRDGKAAYLNDIPRVFHYLLDALSETPELHDLYQWLQQDVMVHYQQYTKKIPA